METFSVKFKAGSLDLAAIVTAFDHHQQFKVEMITREPEPIRLKRSIEGNWTIIQRGSRNLSDIDFESLEQSIDARLVEIYGVKTMLVLLDFSESSLNAADYAAKLTHQLQTTKMILYHSYESLVMPSNTIEMTALKKELSGLVAGRTEVEVRSDERSLISAVNTLVAQEDIGLVITGTTGKNQLEKVLIGSNTIRLVEESIAPVLIVPPGANFETIKKVVFACDLRQVSNTTPALAIKTFVNTIGAKLLVLNVDHHEESFSPESIGELIDLHELWDKEEPEYHYINHEDIATGIMEFAEQQGADLVITVPKVYGFFESMFHRSLTKKLAYHSRFPLLLFKADI
ncbi:universal stress protein [Pedobacter steynii]|nr:universal stress protein [Pedobacter steynii]NQX41333.1 universal stress protein [Pedobacter steynii]